MVANEFKDFFGPSGKLHKHMEKQQKNPWKVVLQILSPVSETITVEVENASVIGRSGSGRVKPHIDLSPHRGLECGISRQHAILMPTDEGLAIVDLESSNGTRINGDDIESGRRYPLQTGDRLELGTMRLLVRLAGLMDRGYRSETSTLVPPPNGSNGR